MKIFRLTIGNLFQDSKLELLDNKGNNIMGDIIPLYEFSINSSIYSHNIKFIIPTDYLNIIKNISQIHTMSALYDEQESKIEFELLLAYVEIKDSK